MKILQLAQEMQSFLTVSEKTLEAAKKSFITTENNTNFKYLVEDWGAGAYDEDPDLVLQRIEHLL